MPADTDHIRRDALHAARSEVRILVSKYIRRLDAEAYAFVQSALTELDGEVDGTEIGRDAARAAIAKYIGHGDVHEVVDARPTAIAPPADA